MLIFYRVKWFFHCLFRFHRQMTIHTMDGQTMVGCYECGMVNNKEGDTYVAKRVEK